MNEKPIVLNLMFPFFLFLPGKKISMLNVVSMNLSKIGSNGTC